MGALKVLSTDWPLGGALSWQCSDSTKKKTVLGFDVPVEALSIRR